MSYEYVKPAIRCYVIPDTSEDAEIDKIKLGKKPSRYGKWQSPTDYSVYMVFDTESTTDVRQALTFGFAGTYANDQLVEMILFYNEKEVSKKDFATIAEFAKENNCVLMTRHEFVNRRLFPTILTYKHPLIGFNLPFDISHIATAAAEARTRGYEGGFSFTITENRNWPRILVKHKDSKSAFIRLSTSMYDANNKEIRQRVYEGCFIDLRTATFAVTDKHYSLESACKDFGVATQKKKPSEHGKITKEYLDYAMTDVLATQGLYVKVKERFAMYGIYDRYDKIFSPASIGKIYLANMGVKSFFEKNPTFDPKILGLTMSAYYGGWVEILHRCEPIRVAYLDFLSQYPTLITLFDLDKFVKAENISVVEATEEAQKLLDSLTLADLQRQETWKNMHFICELIPNGDMLPVRATYGEDNAYNIGYEHVTSEGQPLAYALPDLLGSKLMSGKTPKITKAYKFVAGPQQEGLKDIDVLPKITVTKDQSFVKTLIEERQKLKLLKKQATSAAEKEELDIKQNILKIIANACGYGIYVEMNPQEEEEAVTMNVFSLDAFKSKVTRIERTGKAFNPVLACMITSGAKLLQAMAQRVVENVGGYVAYRDTDSLFVSPAHVETVQAFFKSLNPYNFNDDVLKVEDSKLTGKELRDVWFYGISAKRYVLYDKLPNGQYIIHKYSSHGIGALQLADSDELLVSTKALYGLTAPKVTNKDFEALVWWINILKTQENKNYFPMRYFKRYAVCKFGVTSANLLKRFAYYNKGKDYDNQIKPFNFAMVGHAVAKDPETNEPIIPYTPFTKNPSEVSSVPFVDIKTGKIYDEGLHKYWKPLATEFTQYIVHPEAKMNGSIGRLERKHVLVAKGGITIIGKEVNEMDLIDTIGVQKNTTLVYRNCPAEILTLCEKDVEGKLSRRQLYRLKEKARNGEQINVTDKVARVLE